MSDNNPYATPRATITDIPGNESMELASRWRRLFASILDALIVIVIFAVVGGIIGAALAVTGTLDSDWFNIFINPTLTYTLVSTVLYLVVFIGINASRLRERGQTIGKSALGIRIVTENGEVPTLGTCVKRFGFMSALGIVPAAGGLLSLANLLCIFRGSRQCLHDNIASTRVVNA